MFFEQTFFQDILVINIEIEIFFYLLSYILIFNAQNHVITIII